MSWKISGKVTYQDLEGGFYGIETDKGEKLRPVKPLPKAFEEDGKKVVATVEQHQGVSLHMWGTAVDVLEIEAV